MPLMQRILNVFRTRRIEDELREELEFHLAARTEEYIREGMSAHDARERAQREFGNRTAVAERARDANIAVWFEGVLQDIRYAGRQIRRSPGFASVSIASLALGIGATAALFSVLDAVVLQPLALPNPHEMVQFRESRRGNPQAGSPARLKDFQGARSFAGVAGFYQEGVTLRRPEGPVRLSAFRTFGPATATLAARPILGRTFTSKEEIGEASPVALITHKTWQKHFGGTSNVLGQTFPVGKDACTIVGVLPATLTFPDEIDLWIPAPSVFQNLNRPSYFLNIVGRLAPGVTLSQASAEMQSISARLWKEYPATDADIQVHLSSLQDAVVEDTRTPLLTLLAAVGAVLMVACVNIAGLMLARGWARQRESGVRAALGAGVGRLVRLRFFEVAWLAAIGGVCGLYIAYGAIALLKVVLPSDVPRLAAVQLDARAALFTLGAAILCALLAALPPAWHEAMGPMIERMRQGSGGSVGPGKRRLRSALVVGQVALSMTLLVCAALLGHSLLRMQQVRLGFQPEHAIAMHTAFGWDTGAVPIRSFSREVVDRLSALPGVSEAGVVDRLPLNGGAQSSPMVIRGRELSPELASQSVGFRTASAGYFRALRIPVLRGTLFPDHPDENGPKLVVVNERFAKRYFPDGDPVGQMIKAHPTAKAVEDKDWFRIVGVVGDTRTALRDINPMPEVYQAWGQAHWPLMAFVVRTEAPLDSMYPLMRKAAAAADPNQPVDIMQPLTALLPESTAASRAQTGLLGGFALFALLLSAVGLYGLLSGEVARRTQEFGVRLALGAEPSALLASALRRGMTLLVVGLVLGILAASAASRYLQTLLFEVQPYDVPATLAAAAILVAVGLFACWIPASRAANVDPMIALRHE